MDADVVDVDVDVDVDADAKTRYFGSESHDILMTHPWHFHETSFLR